LQAAQAAAEQAAGGQEATPQRPQAAQTPKPAVQQQPPQRPAQQPDPVAAERQQLAYQRQVTTELAQMSEGEGRAWHTLNALRDQFLTSYPEVRDQKTLRETFIKNPERYKEIESARLQFEHGKAVCQRDFQLHRQARITRQSELADFERKQTDAAVAKYNRANDEAFNQWFTKTYPGQKLSEVTKYTQIALRNAGVPDARVAELWKSGALRGVEVQQILAKAGLHEMGLAKARDLNSKKVQPPPVQRPGVYRAAGSGDDIAALGRDLDRATGNQSIRAATRLMQAKRRAGQL